MGGMLEKIARIINPIAWSELAAQTWRAGAIEKERVMALKTAKAVIEAMREPTEAMCDTAAEVHNVWGFGATDAATAYRAMIDAALASPPTEREES